MTVKAHLVEVQGDGGTSARGEFEFVASPSAGDQVVVGTLSGSLDVFRVNFIEHDPVAIPHAADTRADPRLTVFVTLIGDVD